MATRSSSDDNGAVDDKPSEHACDCTPVTAVGAESEVASLPPQTTVFSGPGSLSWLLQAWREPIDGTGASTEPTPGPVDAPCPATAAATTTTTTTTTAATAGTAATTSTTTTITPGAATATATRTPAPPTPALPAGNGQRKHGLIDARPLVSYCAGHIRGACHMLFDRSHRSPWAPRTMLLPPAGASVCVVCASESDAIAIAADLASRTMAVRAILIVTETHDQAFCQALQATTAAAAAGVKAKAAATAGAAAVPLPHVSLLEVGDQSTALWSPLPFLENSLGAIEAATDRRTVLDVGCGAGRDAVWLAQRGWHVTGVDRQESLLSCAEFFGQDVRDRVVPVVADIEADPSALPQGPFGLVLVVRYLHRPIIPKLLALAAPGGVCVFATFLMDAVKPRRPQFKLEPGELEAIFTRDDWQILASAPRFLLADGRPMAAIVAAHTGST
eukprot:m.10124 g.10124  ORF g.10124 m.10124 type:complete len:446 (-) comp3691_c0_seq1:183-1520(-)